MLEDLKEKVCEANLELVRRGMVIYTWGNVSEIDRTKGLIVIKPSGVNYDSLKPEDMVVVDLKSGNRVEGRYRPSSDTATHLELYRCFSDIGGITHTHSINAVAFAQAGLNIETLGTTHADYFSGTIPCTRELTEEEVLQGYEENTGRVIVECFNNNKINPQYVPGVIVKNHGPFCWGKDANESVYHAVVMETIAEMNLRTLLLNPKAKMAKYVIDKHFWRKHGKNAYYGQS